MRWPDPRWILIAAMISIGGLGLRAELEAKRSGWTGPAEWIWWTTTVRQREPVAFVAYRDFTVATRTGAELRLAGDPEYVIYLNGRRIGGGGRGSELLIRRLDLTDLVAPGTNRIAVEMRSADGVGGLLAAIALDGVSGHAVVTDRTWQIDDDWRRAVHPGGHTTTAFPVASWGRPPMHPWGRPRAGVRESALLVAAQPVRQLEEQPAAGGTRHFTIAGGEERGILVVRLADRKRRSFVVATAGASGAERETLAVVPAGKGFWDSPTQLRLADVRISGNDAASVTSVELVPAASRAPGA